MEAVALFFLAVVLGIIWGLRGAGFGVKKAYRKKVDAWDANHSGASWPQRRSAMLAYLFSMLKDGGPALWSGFKEGWAEGRAEAQKKLATWRPDPQASQEQVDPNQPGVTSGGGGANGARPDLRLVPPPGAGPTGGGSTPPPGGSPNGNPGGSTMAVEVVNVETLLAFCQEKERSAATELDDAKAAKERVEQDMTGTSNTIAWMTKEKFHKDDVAEVVAVREAEKSDLAAIGARISACDKKLANAKKATEMAARHVQIAQQKAAGTPYN